MRYVLIRNGEMISNGEDAVNVPWWSFTKTVIAAAALVLVRDKLLFLDEPIEGQPFTLRHLLRHESGLPDYAHLADYHAAVQRGDPPWTVETMLVRAEASRLRFAPGSNWSYSNIGYLHICRLIEKSTDESLASALSRLVLQPLGSTRVRLARLPQDLIDVDMGEAVGYDPRWVYHGLLTGPLTEAALLLNRLMNGALLPEGLLHDMLDFRPLGGPVADRPWALPGYGLGLMVGRTDHELRVAGHTGTGPGSVIAVYHNMDSGDTCAAYSTTADTAKVERGVVSRLSLPTAPLTRPA